MPYTREGALKVSDHWVRSPLLNINRACQQCHAISEEEIKTRVELIQNRNYSLMQRAAAALIDYLNIVKPMRAPVEAKVKAQLASKVQGMAPADAQKLQKDTFEEEWKKVVAANPSLAKALDLQKKGQWRLDFVAAENSMGFHAPQEAARILGESVDYLRQAQLEATKAAAGAKK